jgi:hypothetical protein
MTYVLQKEHEKDFRDQKLVVALYVEGSSFMEKLIIVSTIVILFRQIDVHYSLPRDDHTKGIDREKNQVCSHLVATCIY